MKKLVLAIAILVASFCHAQIDKSKYDYAGNFSECFAQIKEGEKWYVIDTKVNKIKEIQVQRIEEWGVGNNN